MPAYSEERNEQRKQQIIAACRKQYETGDYKDVTMKSVSEDLSFSRASIYNYYRTKEEIFLALLCEEYRLWIADMERCSADDRKSFAEEIAHSLERRELLLRMQAMNIYEIEEYSRQENVTEFKCVFRDAMNAFDRCLHKAVPSLNEFQRDDVLYGFFPMLNGIYPYVHPTEKQAEAMRQAQLHARRITVYEMVCRSLTVLLAYGKGE